MKKIIILGLILLGNFASGYSQNLLTDLRPGLDGSEPVFDNAFQRNNELYFIANPDGITSRLYKTDGTSGNTVVLEGGSNMYVTMLLGFLGNDLLYIAGDIYHGESLGLYKTSGTIGSGQLVSAFNQTNDILVAYPMTITMNNVLYFYGSDGVTGFELWRTDGTGAGTYLVKDINPGIESSFPFAATKQYFAELNGFIYFSAAEPINGCELWKSDGTEAGTMMVANIDTSEATIPQLGSNPAYFCTYNNEVYFSGYRPVDGRELWKTDGTEAGTVLVKDITSGSGSPSDLIVYNGSLYFVAYSQNQDFTLFRSNGTGNGTVVIKEPAAGGPGDVREPIIFNKKLYFGGFHDQGFYAIWFSDGTAAGTNYLPVGPSQFNSPISNLLATTNYLYFNTTNDTNIGIYRTSSQANQINLLTSASFNANQYHSMFLVNNCIVARGDDGTSGEEIYTVCNQNTQPVGLEENALLDLTVFPNPCIDQVSIESSSDLNEVSKLTLHSLSGQSMNLTYTQFSQGKIILKGLSNFNSGLYILTITTKNGANRQVKLLIE
jgi:trimeric autotransporter adhesin